MRELAVREVARGVWVATARTYTTTTTIVAGSDGGCLLVDPAVSVADLAALAGWLGAHGLRPVAGWSTHPHWDHLLWSAALGDAPRYATPRAVAVAAREEAGLIEGVTDGAPGHDLTLFARHHRAARPGDRLAGAARRRARARRARPGPRCGFPSRHRRADRRRHVLRHRDTAA